MKCGASGLRFKSFCNLGESESLGFRHRLNEARERAQFLKWFNFERRRVLQAPRSGKNESNVPSRASPHFRRLHGRVRVYLADAL